MILDEALRNLVADGRMSVENAARLVATMRRAFPEAQVTDYENLIPSMRNDEKDRHVVAAAVKAGAQVIVTSNTKDFYDLPSDIEIQTPDEFLSNLFDLDRPRSTSNDGCARNARPAVSEAPMEIPRILDALALTEFGDLCVTILAPSSFHGTTWSRATSPSLRTSGTPHHHELPTSYRGTNHFESVEVLRSAPDDGERGGLIDGHRLRRTARATAMVILA